VSRHRIVSFRWHCGENESGDIILQNVMDSQAPAKIGTHPIFIIR
jgi:hypothetical protein